MSYQLHKFIGIGIGLICYYFLPEFILKMLTGGTKEPVQRGCDIANVSYGEISTAVDKFGAELLRFNYKEDNMIDAAVFGTMYGVEYFVLIGTPEQTPQQIAADIIHNMEIIGLHKKPKFFSVINEMNEYTYDDLQEVWESLLSQGYNFEVPVIKGSHTGLNEHGALQEYFDYLSGKDKLVTYLPFHTIHYYETFSKKSNAWFNNIIKKAILTYLIIRIRLEGIPASKIIISESNDGEKSWGGVEHGDYVFASGNGWKGIEKTCNRLGIVAVCYYAGPYLNYEGNTMLEELRGT